MYFLLITKHILLINHKCVYLYQYKSFAFEIYRMAHETYRLSIRFLVREIIIIAIICVKNPRITSFLINNMKRLTSEYPDFPILQVPLNYLEFCIKQDADLIRNIIQFLKLVASCNLLFLAKINLLTIQFRELAFEHEFMLLFSLLALFVISC